MTGRFRQDILHVQLINLDGSDERLASATQYLDGLGLDFERLAAFDGRGRKPDEFREYRSRKAVSFYGRAMTGGEMGCYFSHVMAARAFLKSGARFGLVLEDDLKPEPEAIESLAGLIDWATETDRKWDMVNLCLAPRRFFTAQQTLPGNRELVAAYYFPVTTTAVMWSREGAERFLATTNEIYAPLDHFLRRWLSVSGRGLALVPPIFSPSGAQSDLDNEGGAIPARRKVPKSLRYFWMEFRRQSVNYLAACAHLARQKLFGS